MTFFLRFIVVWPLALVLGTLALSFGDIDGFAEMIVWFGLFMTPVAIVSCLIAKAMESKFGGYAGIILMVAVPATLYLIAPNKNNAAAGMGIITQFAVLTGIFWSISYFLARRS